MRAYTREELIALIREVAETSPAGVSLARVAAVFGVSPQVFYRVFGSWVAAVEAALGVYERPTSVRWGWNRGSILAAAESVISDGEPICCEEFCRRSGVPKTSVYRHWGSWTALREAVGGRPTCGKRRYSKEMILDAFRRVVGEQGDVSLREFESLTGIGPSSVRQYWGSCAALRSAAGLEGSRKLPAMCRTADEMLEDYGRIWEQLGRQPRAKDVDFFGVASWSCYMRRWHNALALREAYREAMAGRRAWLERAERATSVDELGPIPVAREEMRRRVGRE